MITIAERPIPLGEQATDERVINPQELTNQEIDVVIQRPPDQLELIIPASYWLILLLIIFDVLQFSSLIIFLIVTFQLFECNTQLERSSSTSRSLSNNFAFTIDTNRDATTEGRTAQVTEEIIVFSNTIEVLEHVPYGIQAAPPSPLILPLVTNNEDNNTNRNEIVIPNIQNGGTVQITNNEDGVQGGRTLPTNEVPNTVEINQINPANEQIVPVRNEALDTETTVGAPADIVQQEIITSTHSTTGALIPKSTNTVRPNDESGDKHTR